MHTKNVHTTKVYIENGLQQKENNKKYTKNCIKPKKYVKNYIQQIFIPQKPNLYIIINVYNKNVYNKKVCKVHKLRYIKQSRIHLFSLQ